MPAKWLTAGILGLSLHAVSQVSVAQQPGAAATRPVTMTLSFSKPGTPPPARLLEAPRPRPIVLGEPYVSSGFITRELPTAATGDPYVSTGYLKVETDRRNKPVSVIAQTMPTTVGLEKRIEQACGRAAKDVDVVPGSPSLLRVSYTVRTVADAEKVSKQILKIPELSPYQVHFNAHVAP
jgi:hypothetical protein